MNLRRSAAKVLIISSGLALGVGGAVVLSEAGSQRRANTPSVADFTFSTVPPGAPAGLSAETPLSPADEPADAPAAAARVLQSLVDGQPESSWSLLDEAGRQRHPTPAAWARARAARPVPTGFEITGTTTAGSYVDVRATVSYRPSLDPFAGLVPARAQQVWRAHHEGGAWRVAAEPVSTQFELPADDGATEAVRSWVTARAACDTVTARSYQAVDPLYGPADVANVPCGPTGDWTVGAPQTLDRAPDSGALLAAFGSEVGSWSRVVPVRGPTNRFLAAVAPLGDAWRVMGVTPDAP